MRDSAPAMTNTTTSRVIPPEDRDGFRFRGGHVALDLPATLAARLKPAPRELLATPADLDRWLVAAGLAGAAPGSGAGDLQEAWALREAIYSLATGTVASRPPALEARGILNRLAGGQAPVPQLDEDGRLALIGTAGSLLILLAREAIHLFGGAQVGRIRQCESATCTLFFLDTSRAGDRRWCSMSGCGNKAKVADYRRRKRLGADAPH